jgi:hypothetical protein
VPDDRRVQRDRREDGRPEQSRPRDRTGRPLPYGTQGIALSETMEPVSVADALAAGVRRWDERRYFEAHELLEHVWRSAARSDKDLWKGVIQVAVAGVHLQRGNMLGARRLIGRALDRLEGLPDAHRGVDVVLLRRTAQAASDLLDAGQVPPADWGPFPARADAAAGVQSVPPLAAPGPLPPSARVLR